MVFNIFLEIGNGSLNFHSTCPRNRRIDMRFGKERTLVLLADLAPPSKIFQSAPPQNSLS